MSKRGKEEKIGTRERQKETKGGVRGEGRGRWRFGIFSLSFLILSGKYLPVPSYFGLSATQL